MTRWWQFLGGEARYVLGLYLLLLSLLSLLRLAFLGSHAAALQGIEVNVMGRGLLLGARFDLAVVSYLLLPVFLWLLWSRGVKPRRLDAVLLLLAAGLVLAGLVVLVDGHPLGPVLQARIFPRIDLPAGTCSARLAALFGLVLWLLFWAGLRWLGRRCLAASQGCPPGQDQQLRLMGATFLLALMLIAARDGLSRKPLAWADAAFSSTEFANLLPLNGVCFLGHALFFASTEPSKKTPRSLKL